MTPALGASTAPLRSNTSRARLVTIVWLVSSCVSIVLLPLVGVEREVSPALRVSGVIGIVGFLIATVVAVWCAVTPWARTVVQRRSQAAFTVSAVASVPLVAPVAAGTWPTWAWLGAAIIGVAPLLWRWEVAAAVSLLSIATSVATAVLVGGSVVDHLVVTGAFGISLAVINGAPVWLWELVVSAEAAQDSAARLAVAQERLRFARDVHDVLGHDLTAIALKSELAARIAGHDPHAAARESAEVRRLAETALERVRAAVAGEHDVDLPAELGQIASLLDSAGVSCDLRVQPASMTTAAAGALSAVAKEAATNVLRHSSARACRIQLSQTEDGVHLDISNDGATPRRATGPTGSGLAGMSWRLAPLGGSVVTEHDSDTFALRAWVPTAP